jgi:hypothetical protein
MAVDDDHLMRSVWEAGEDVGEVLVLVQRRNGATDAGPEFG